MATITSVEVDKKVIFNEDKYQKAVLDEAKKPDVETLVSGFVTGLISEMTDDEKRAKLPLLKGNATALHGAVDTVMETLPAGVERVDGSSIRPILYKVIDAEVAKLPKPKIEKMI